MFSAAVILKIITIFFLCKVNLKIYSTINTNKKVHWTII